MIFRSRRNSCAGLLGMAVAAGTVAIAWQSPITAEVPNMTELLVVTSNMMNKNLPMMIDGDTRWDSSSAGPGKTLNYKYTLVNYSAQDIDGKQFARSIHSDLAKSICTNPATEIFPDNGVLLNFNYHDKAQNLIARVKVAPSDCDLVQRKLSNHQL